MPVFYGSAYKNTSNIGINTEILQETGSFAVSGNSIKEMPIPSRSSVILTCFSGAVTDLCKKEIDDFSGMGDVYPEDDYYPSKLLLHLNSKDHKDSLPESSNYADLIDKRIIQKLDGTWAFTLAYLTISGRGRIVIAKKNRNIFFHFVSSPTFTALTWSDESNLFSSLTDYFVYSITPLYDKDSIVIHPLYLIEKWRTWSSKKAKGQNFLVITILENYLSRTAR